MANNNVGAERAVATIINSVRSATRSERQNSLYNDTRSLFRGTSSSTSSRNVGTRVGGRRLNEIWKKQMFLLRRCNPDFYPSQSECVYLQSNGLGRVKGTFCRQWSSNRLQRYIIQSYRNYPLEDTGFRFAKCSRDKKIQIIERINSVHDLERSIGRGTLIIVPNRDLEILDDVETSASTSNTSVHHSDPSYSTRYNISDDSDFEIDSFVELPPRRTVNSTLSNADMQEEVEVMDEDEHVPDIDLDELTDNPSSELLTLLDDAVETVTVEISRDSLFPQMLKLYKEDEGVVLKAIKVVFKGEIGLDYGGLTKELFTKFWKDCRTEYFRGENACVPFLPLSKIRKGLSEDFIIIGRILAHTLLLTKTLPTHLAKCAYLLLGNLEKKVPDNVIDEDFLFFLTDTEKRLVKKALSKYSELNEFEHETLIDFFQTYGLLELPKEGEIQQQIRSIGENILCKEPYELLKKMKDGIPLVLEPFFQSLNYEKLQVWYKKQLPTSAKLLKILETQPSELNNLQSKVYYFLKTFIRNLNSTEISKFLLFFTASEHMPDKIVVSFKHFGFPVAHSCSNTLELPTSSSTYQELADVLRAMINDDGSYEYSIL